MRIIMKGGSEELEKRLSILYLRCGAVVADAVLAGVDCLSILYLRCANCARGWSHAGTADFQFSI